MPSFDQGTLDEADGVGGKYNLSNKLNNYVWNCMCFRSQAT